MTESASILISPDPVVWLALTIPGICIFSFMLLYLAGRYLPRKGDMVATISMFLAFFLSVFLFVTIYPAGTHLARVPWFVLTGESGFLFTASIQVTPLSVLMACVVTLISALVHLYSIEYMEGKRNYLRYFPYLSLFTFSMLGIIFSDNLLVTFMFWELVGFSSYLLIGFWFEKDSAAKAARKAFLYNRLADVGFLLGLVILWAHFHTLEITLIQEQVTTLQGAPVFLSLAGAGLLLGCMGKSAQFPLSGWLADAMEGPTPVSALIHAATMVAAGVYLLFKVHHFLTPPVLTLAAVVGTVTAFSGAIAALTQNDIKKVLAYSTVSQLGYMFLAVGVGAYDAAMFHLITHAFFKAGLFLSIGAVIQSMHHIGKHLTQNHEFIDFNTLDMRLMGGMWKKLPVTFAAYTVSAAALIGLPFFSGFLSKEAILLNAVDWAGYSGNAWSYLVPAIGIITVFLTAFYLVRQYIMIFFNRFRLAEFHETVEIIFEHLKEVSWLMKFPMVLLGILSFWVFYSWNPFHFEYSWVFELVQPEPFRSVFNPALLSFVVLLIALAGAAYAYIKFMRQPVKLRAHTVWGYRISKNNFHVDNVLKFTLVGPVFKLGNLMERMDSKGIDFLVQSFAVGHVVVAHVVAIFDALIVDGMVNLLARLSGRLGNLSRQFFSGKIADYVLYLGLALVIVLILFIF